MAWLRHPALWLSVALTIGAAAPRLIQADAPSAFMDELLWLGEGKRTLERLARGPAPPSEWKRDLSHPGVLVALVGGWAQRRRPPHATADEVHAQVLGAARRAIALASILTVLAVFALGAPLVGRRAAGLGAVLLAASPFHVAMGPWLECDSLLTLWTTVSLLSAARYLHDPRRRTGWLVLCAFATGQALVAKMSGVLLLPVLGAALVLWPGGRGPRELLRPAAPVFLGLVAAVVYASWPRIWLDPGEVLDVLAWGRHVAGKGHPNFFLGEITRSPPWTYYLAVVPLRLGEVELAGLVGAAGIALAALVRRRGARAAGGSRRLVPNALGRRIGRSGAVCGVAAPPSSGATRRRGALHPTPPRPPGSVGVWHQPPSDPQALATAATLLVLVAFAVIWVAFFSAQPKKLGARYVLPIWPVVALLGGWAAARAIEALTGARARALATSAVVLLAVGQLAWTMAPVWPDRLVATNRLLGGLDRAARVELVGYGVVERDIARVIDALPRGARVAIAAHPTSVAWHTRRRFAIVRDPGLERALARGAWDTLVVARYERVRRPILDRALSKLRVVEVIRRGGVELAWVLDARAQRAVSAPETSSVYPPAPR